MLLAFDTATPHVTVALHDGSRVVAAYESEESMRHGEMLAPGIEHVLEEAGAKAADLTEIAVGVGPGPFTGLRVGLVTARTLAFALDLPVHGVCSLDVLAAAAVDEGLEEFAVATDARRKEVYLASYAGGRRVSGPEVVKPGDAATEVPTVGRGARLYPDTFPDARDPEHPSAAVLCDVVRRATCSPRPASSRRSSASQASTARSPVVAPRARRGLEPGASAKPGQAPDARASTGGAGPGLLRRQREEHRGAGGVLGIAGPFHHRLLQQLGAGGEEQEERHHQRREHGGEDPPGAPTPASQMPHHTHASPK